MFTSFAIAGATLLAGGAAPPGFHAFAAINDSLSHGQVGDGFLSLNEAIQLHNNTLLLNQLSPAEQAQIALIPGTGTSTFLSWARLDATVTPVITVERDLDVIVNTSYGLYFSSDNGQTVLDFSGPGVQFGMRATSNSLQMRDLVFSGGPGGLDVVQTDIAGQIGLAVNACRFENQSLFGVRVVTNTPNGFGKLYLEGCVFDGATTGVVWDEWPAGRTSFFDLHDCRITGATDGVLLTLGNGGLGRYTFDRLVIEAQNRGIELARPSFATRAAQVRGLHVEVRAATCASIAAAFNAPTSVQLRMLHLWSTAAPTGIALDLGDIWDDVSGVVEDSTFAGVLAVSLGGGSSPMSVQNVRCRDGTVLFETTVQPLAVTDSRFDNCFVLNQGTGAVTFTNCCFAASSLSGSTPGATSCDGCYLPTGGQFVTITNPLPAEQLGGLRVLPDAPTVGGTVTLQADLPAGLWGAFLLGFTDPNPALPWPQPLHVYGMLNNTFLLPGVYRFQQSFLWPIPNNPLFAGVDFVAQIAILPDPGVSALPAQLAPGRRFALQ